MKGDVTCRGCFKLGTACGVCSKCKKELKGEMPPFQDFVVMKIESPIKTEAEWAAYALGKRDGYAEAIEASELVEVYQCPRCNTSMEVDLDAKAGRND